MLRPELAGQIHLDAFDHDDLKATILQGLANWETPQGQAGKQQESHLSFLLFSHSYLRYSDYPSERFSYHVCWQQSMCHVGTCERIWHKYYQNSLKCYLTSIWIAMLDTVHNQSHRKKHGLSSVSVGINAGINTNFCYAERYCPCLC